MDRETKEVLAVMGGFFAGLVIVFIIAMLIIGNSHA